MEAKAHIYMDAKDLELIDPVARQYPVSRSLFMRLASLEKAQKLEKLLQDRIDWDVAGRGH